MRREARIVMISPDQIIKVNGTEMQGATIG
jgi:hypothetical protein